MSHIFKAQWLRLFCLCVALTAFSDQTHAQTANYDLTDNVEEVWVNLNLPPIRPMILWAGLELYAVNTHDSTVSRYTTLSGQPTSTFRVPWGPVSLAEWTDPDGSEQLLVVCRGSYSLVFLDRITGQTLNILELPAEPGDILVDQNTHQAYISCSAQDMVVEIDLLTPAIGRQWTIPGKNPLFMSFDSNMDVLVSPLFSGNNSAINKTVITAIGQSGNTVMTPNLDSDSPGVIDLTAAYVTGPGLPDEDLFRVIRSSGVVQPVTTGMGTILFANGVNPVTGRVWQIGTDADNKDPNKQTEPKLKGDFVDNILSIANLPNTTSAANGPFQTINLDDSDNNPANGVQFDPALSVGQPYGLHFDPSTGLGFITGLLTDNVMVRDANGNIVGLSLDVKITDVVQ